MSAARLAAEQAFCLPEPQALPAPETVVVVKRARVVAPALPAAMPADSSAPQQAVEAKGPRIFRVESQAGVHATSPGTGADATATAVASPDEGDFPGAPAASRRQRASAHRRPGPLLQVFQAPAPPPAAVHGGRIAHLLQSLAEVEAVFDAIRYARSFRVRDDDFDSAWRDLWAEADEIQQQMRVQLDAKNAARGDFRADPGLTSPTGGRRPRGTRQTPQR